MAPRTSATLVSALLLTACGGTELARLHRGDGPGVVSLARLQSAETDSLLRAHLECKAREGRQRHRRSCYGIEAELGARRIEPARRYVADNFFYAPALGHRMFSGSCEEAGALASTLDQLLGPASIQGGTLPGWREEGFHLLGAHKARRELGRDLPAALTMHAITLLRCHDGVGLDLARRFYDEDLRPFAIQEGRGPHALPETSPWIRVIASLWSYHAWTLAELDTTGPLLGAELREVAEVPECATSPALAMAMMSSFLAEERIAGCSCLDMLDTSEAESSAELRSLLARYDLWTETRTETRKTRLPTPRRPRGRRANAGDAIVALASLVILPIAALAAAGSSKRVVEAPDLRVRLGCAPIGVAQHPAPSLRIVAADGERASLDLFAFVQEGLSSASDMALVSVGAEGEPDGAYCQATSRRAALSVSRECEHTLGGGRLTLRTVDGEGREGRSHASTSLRLHGVHAPPRASLRALHLAPPSTREAPESADAPPPSLEILLRSAPFRLDELPLREVADERAQG